MSDSVQITDPADFEREYWFRYTYKRNGALESMTYPTGRKVSYTHDRAGRPSGAGGYATGIQYAPHGAVEQMTMGNGLVANGVYNSRLQPSRLDLGSSNLLNLFYGWGGTANNGNLAWQKLQVQTAIDVTQTYTYDELNRLATVAEGANWSRGYGYDRYGNRWVSSSPGVPVSPLTPVAESWFDAATNRLVGLGDAFGKLAAEYTTPGPVAPTTSYLTTDHLGSTRLVTNESGQVKERHDYLPFGEELYAGTGGRTTEMGYLDLNDPGTVTQKFTGQERDAETGLDYFGARYMSSAQGRFTSPDPYNPMMIAQMSIAGGLPAEAAHSHMQDFLENPQNWNRYTYVRNNPLALVDPFGQSPVPAGHHLIPSRVYLGPIGTEFANAIKTGPLANNFPNQPGFNTLHRAYNAAAEGILQQFERQFGASRSAWSVSQWRQAANGILNSQLPSIRNFLDLLNRNNAGKAIPALAAAISNYTPSAGLVAEVVGSSLLRLLRMPLILFIDTRVVTDPERRDPEPDRQPPHERCLKNRDGSCVI